MHSGLRQCSPSGHYRKHRDKKGQHKQHDLHGTKPEPHRIGYQIEAIAMVGIVSPMHAIAEPNARFRLVSMRL